LKRTGAYRLLAVVVACAAVVALVCARGAGAQQSQPVDVYQAPSIQGTAQSGQSLSARYAGQVHVVALPLDGLDGRLPRGQRQQHELPARQR
jgi:hypothetical protein